MQKGVFAGIGAGLLILAFFAGSWYANQAQTTAYGRSPAMSSPVTAPTGAATGDADKASSERSAVGSTATDATSSAHRSLSPDAKATPDVASSPASSPWSRASTSPVDKTPLTREERRAIHAKVREQINALLAKGSKVSLADTAAFIDEVEKTGKGVFEPQYFDAMREVVKSTQATQQLSQELGAIATSTAPRDVARKKVLLLELKEAGNQINSQIALMQSHAREAAKAVSQ